MVVVLRLCLLPSLVLAGACGRLSFDSAPGPDAAAVDAATDAVAADAGPDAAPDAMPALPISCLGLPDTTLCDDRNACTARSTCAAEQCEPDEQATTCELASSMTDFAQTQGVHGWTYGYYRPGDDADGVYAVADFRASDWLDEAWRPPDYSAEFTWTYLMAWGGHPAVINPTWPIRRWVSATAGPATIQIQASKSDVSCGDGVRCVLFVDGVEVWSATIAFDDDLGVTQDVALGLEVGTAVDIAFQALADEACDTFDSAATIHVP
jgi:hypothetical protein